jgi:hypothetical protein
VAGLGQLSSSLATSRSQASSRHPVQGMHILRRLIDISQIAVQKGNFRRLQKAVSLCSLDDPFNDASTPGLKQPGRPYGALNVVVPLVAESLGGLGGAAVKLFAEIATEVPSFIN